MNPRPPDERLIQPAIPGAHQELVNLDALFNALMTAAVGGDKTAADQAYLELRDAYQFTLNECMWYREEKHMFNGFLAALRNGGNQNWLAVPTGELNYRHLYRVEYEGEKVDNTNPDGVPPTEEA